MPGLSILFIAKDDLSCIHTTNIPRVNLRSYTTIQLRSWWQSSHDVYKIQTFFGCHVSYFTGVWWRHMWGRMANVVGQQLIRTDPWRALAGFSIRSRQRVNNRVYCVADPVIDTISVCTTRPTRRGGSDRHVAVVVWKNYRHKCLPTTL